MSYLNKHDSQKLKGISIIMIVLHNFLHLTNDIGENEFKLDQNRFYYFLSRIIDSPMGVGNFIFSYLGWYFIVVFIFITAYGVSFKLMSNNKIFDVVIYQIMKTISLLICGGVTLYIFSGYNINDISVIIIGKISSIDNFLYSTIYNGVGSWWYFGLFFQLCLVIPLVYVIYLRVNVFFLYLTSYFFLLLIYFFFTSVNVFATAIGHVPEIIFAISFLKGAIVLKWRYCIFSFAIFYLSNINDYLFSFTYLSFLYCFLFVFFKLNKILDFLLVGDFLIFIGLISPFIFVLNGPIRNISLASSKIFENSPYENVWFLLSSFMHLFCVIFISFFVSVLVKNYMSYVNENVLEVLKNIKSTKRSRIN